MECFKDDKTANLFLEINPNIDEIAKEQEEMNEEASLDHKQSVTKQEKYDHEDVFEEGVKGEEFPLPVKRSRGRPRVSKPKSTQPPVLQEESVSLENEIIQPKQEEVSLPMTYREKKKLERQKLKEEEKERKRIEKEKHREIMKEKNRQKARERYYKIKAEKDAKKEQDQKEIPKQIVEESKKNLNSFQKRDLNTKLNSNNDMDFVTFTNYMLKYEELKSKFNKQKQQEEEEKKQREKQKSPFPDNYPVHLLYGNRKNRRNKIF
jgi:hypothetical protein